MVVAGLGLAICRQIIERMQGRLWVEAAPGGGARFCFDLCLPQAAAEDLGHPLAEPEPTPHETLHVLIVDDNATNRFVASRVLDLFNCSHATANDGQQAVEMVTQQAFDLVLMDVKMPVMDGIAATRAIRGLDGVAAQVPILALTANADPRDEMEYLAAGMNGVAQKPIQPDVLLNAIRRVLTPADLEHAAA